MRRAETAPPARRRLRAASLATGAPTRFSLHPDAAERAAIAKDLGLLVLSKLRFEVEVAPGPGENWVLRARLGATVQQPCVVTLAPVTTRIDEDVSRRFLEHLPEDAVEEREIEMPEDETIERLGQEIDLWAVMVESLALALPAYPRAAEAQGEAPAAARAAPPGVAPMSDQDARPFASLSALRDKLAKGD